MESSNQATTNNRDKDDIEEKIEKTELAILETENANKSVDGKISEKQLLFKEHEDKLEILSKDSKSLAQKNEESARRIEELSSEIQNKNHELT